MCPQPCSSEGCRPPQQGRLRGIPEKPGDGDILTSAGALPAPHTGLLLTSPRLAVSGPGFSRILNHF